MTNRDTQLDGGVMRETDTEGDEQPVLDLDLPDDSLLTREEYLEMYETAASEPAFSIMQALREEEKLSASELGALLDRADNSLHYHLRKLKRCALVRNRRDPNTGTEETYSYYELTDLGQVVLTEGLLTGVQKLAAEEQTISESYER